jgi:hypothetical protein
MAASDIERDFPSLTADNYKRTSDEDFNYNCLAFALGDLANWWEPPGEFGFYWPPGFANDLTVETVATIINLHGYLVEIDKRTKPSAEAIAIYAKDREWTHFAKYTGGQWMSKLGDDHDIAHSSLDLLEGDLYGEVVRILSRETK